MTKKLADFKEQVQKIRQQFPILNQKVNGYPLVYLDNSATTQKPKQVIQSIVDFYSLENSSSHSPHFLASQVGYKVEQIRQKVLNFTRADDSYDCIFTKGATESLNLVASAWGLNQIQEEDVILSSVLEHHSNYLPFLDLVQKKQAKLELVQLNQNKTDFDYDDLELKIDKFKPKIVAISGGSNVLGNVTDVNKIVKISKKNNSVVVVDTTQLVAHQKLKISDWGADFIAFSGHKMYAPTGIGCLIIKKSILEKMAEYQLGGEMVDEVWLEKVKYQTGARRFEAGTLDFAGVVGLGSAVDFLIKLRLDFPDFKEYENLLNQYLVQQLSQIEKVKIVSMAGFEGVRCKSGNFASSDCGLPLTTFEIKGYNSFDVASYLDIFGIAVRSGKHCTGILHQILGLENGSIRASLSFYNTKEEVDFMVQKIKDYVQKF